MSRDPRHRRRLFGTDGIRGAFGAWPLDRDTVTRLGVHLPAVLADDGRPPVFVLGGDTRVSTPELCRWLAHGVRAGGGDVRYAGVVPTPGVALLARELGADAGIAVSASHNRLPDNGIKLIDGDGFKCDVALERELERRLVAEEGELPAGEGEALADDPDLVRRYLDGLAARLPGDRPLAGLHVVVDAAHGAASPWAGALFRRLGARVDLRFAEPDGRNINEGCGSTHPEVVARATVGAGAHLGIAFDGDADRALLADADGRVRDGDAILYLWARSLAAAGRLEPKRIVATSMSNLGLERALARDGIEVVRCDVGDRVVVETMRREGIELGGEQSGHIVHLGLTTTGDGMLTALQMAALVRRAGRPLADLLADFRRYPQLLVNVPVRDKPDLESLPEVAAAARAAEEDLGEEGRLVLRYSGTEPLARIMIEGPEEGRIEALAGRIATAIDRAVGAGETPAGASREEGTA